MSDEQLPVISIDQAEAVELIELLEFVEVWLASAGPTINEAFRRFVGTDAYSLTALRAELLTWAARFALAPAEPH
ncbi:MAG: hypothetical protein M0Z88_02685 [Actinomycetota bacterium]|nr:hypothetical protein [Actinomycetota bacterium]